LEHINSTVKCGGIYNSTMYGYESASTMYSEATLDCTLYFVLSARQLCRVDQSDQIGLEKYPARLLYARENSLRPTCWSGKGKASSVYQREGMARAGGSLCFASRPLQPTTHPTTVNVSQVRFVKAEMS
jgi:hypothetical protein